jgi:hypothetical protein
LLKGKTVAIDATTLEANAAMRSIVRRDTGESYQAFLTALAQASGIDTPSRERLASLRGAYRCGPRAYRARYPVLGPLRSAMYRANLGSCP